MDYCRFEQQMTRIIPSFAGFTEFTSSIPKLYWNVRSQEQRILALCESLGKVICYADMLGENVDEIKKTMQEILDGTLDPMIEAAIAQWFEDNQPQIMTDIQNLQDADDNFTAIIGTGFTAEDTVADKIQAANQAVVDERDARILAVQDEADARALAIDNLRKELKIEGLALDTIVLGEIEYNDFNNMKGHVGAIADLNNNSQVIISEAYGNVDDIGYWRTVSIENNLDNYTDYVQSYFGHANSIAYNENDGYVYIAPVSTYVGGSAQDVQFIKRYSTSGQFVQNIYTPENIVSLGYDYVTEKMYCYAKYGNLYEYDYSDNTFELIGNISNIVPSNFPTQDMAVRNGRLYIISYFGALFEIDIETISLLNLYTINAVDFSDYFYTGEFNGIEFNKNGNLLCVGCVGSSEGEHVFVLEIAIGFARPMLNYMFTLGAGNGRFFRNNQVNYYVNQATTKLRGHGRDNTNPAKSITMLDCMQNIKSPVIVLQGDYTCYNLVLNYTENALISMASHKLTITNTLAFVGGHIKFAYGTLEFSMPFSIYSVSDLELVLANMVIYDIGSNGYIFPSWNAGYKFIKNSGTTFSQTTKLYQNGPTLTAENSINIAPLTTNIS